LEHIVERIILLSRNSDITLDDLPEFLWFKKPREAAVRLDLPEEGMNLSAVEKDLILRALAKFSGNQTSAARYLGLSRRTLAYRMKKYRLQPGVTALRKGA
jgi:two-component system NtrC family response regulator